MSVETLLKQPAEVLKRQPVMALSSAPSAVTASVVARGLVAGAAALVATPSIVDGVVSVALAGGTDGERYLVTVTATATSGEVVQAELDVAVIDAAWVMPDGGTGYLTIAEFVERVGLREVIAATDEVGDGRINRAMLVNALVDAQSVVDLHFASRYQVPLVDPPLIVKKLVADIARAGLYPRGAPDGVADALKNTMRMLERIQSGAISISLPTAAAPAVSDNPVLIVPGRRAYPDGLCDYP